MRWVLSIETSTKSGGVGLLEYEHVLGIRRFNADMTASEHLIPFISDLLEKQGMAPNELSALALSVGPGSFTGLRVGMTAAKTMAMELQIPILAVSSLHALSLNTGDTGSIVGAIMDARKGQIYGAYFKRNDRDSDRLTADQVMTIEAFLDRQLFDRITLVGDGVPAYRERISGLKEVRLIESPALLNPTPENVGLLALAGKASGYSGDDIHKLSPVYLRRSEAEENWDRKHGSQ